MGPRVRCNRFLDFMKALTLLLICGLSNSSSALNEIFDTYHSAACLAQGNACTASVSGYASHFYNPAGLARFNKKTNEVHLVVAEGHANGAGFGRIMESKSFGTYRMFPLLRENPGNYHFFALNSLPSFTIRNFSFALLGNYQFAAVSDGTNLDIDTRQDLVPTVGISRHFAGNLLRLGVSVKAVYRNQMQGVITHSALEVPDNQISALSREGLGFSLDTGMMLTLPYRFVPTLGIAWNNMGTTTFEGMKFLNTQAQGAPSKIPQSFHAGFSISPLLNRSWKSVFSIDYRHIELTHLPWKKHFHLGWELTLEKTLFIWTGLNQMLLTGGVGLRIQGGHLEIGTYAKDIGDNETLTGDRRYFCRYTISF